MAHYFFHLRDGIELLADTEGRDLADLAHVATAALGEARAILAEDVRGGTMHLDLRIDVADEQGAIVHILPFADALTIVRPAGRPTFSPP